MDPVRRPTSRGGAPARSRPLLLLLFLPLVLAASWSDERVLDPEMHHFGDSETPEWPEASPTPTAGRYELVFEASANDVEHVLVLAQRHVNDAWSVVLNGREVARLERHLDLRDVLYPLPPGTLVDGENLLAVVPTTTTDDITVGRVRLVAEPLRDLLDLRPVRFRATDADTGRPLPVRLTLRDAAGEPARLFHAASDRTAVRDGLLYLGAGEGDAELPRGRYTVWATRGTEWGLDRAEVDVGDGLTEVALSLRREVDTTGWLAVDTHIHTLTFSGHGDASTEERQVTLAGEGVEIAVATDHNHNTDYRPAQWATRTGKWFTAVTGNEVTTSNGHFNAFPLDPADPVPAWDGDWTEVVQGARDKGAKVVVLNHPRWPDHATGPFGVFDLDVPTGSRARGPAFTFDAMELVNATVVDADPMQLYRDWFGLLDRGLPVAAVGSSDSHTVGDPVGSGRTYVPSATDDPTAADVDAACEAIAAGRTTFGSGIFCTLEVEAAVGGGAPGLPTRAAPGELLAAPEGAVVVRLRVAAPSWVRPRTARVFADGVEVASLDVPASDGVPTDAAIELAVDLTAPHDAWLVCVVEGDPVDGPYYPLVNGYTQAGTNPVFLDVDGDGAWSSPRDTARALLAADVAAGRELDGPSGCDAAVALQYLDLLGDLLVERTADALQDAGRAAAEAHPSVGAWLGGRPAPGAGEAWRDDAVRGAASGEPADPGASGSGTPTSADG